MPDLHTFSSREQWLEARGKTIGGSDAAAALGRSPWKTNVQLWEELTGRRESVDISGSAAVVYGTKAEPHILALFALDYPDLNVDYDGTAFWTNPRYPFAHASVDGRLTDRTGSTGILEIKTSTITSGMQTKKWAGQIPENYYIQCLYYMGVLEASFVILRALLTFSDRKEMRDYYFSRHEVRDDLRYVMSGVEDFYRYVLRDERPPLLLPDV